jgi:cadmium resistance protein CadD (predicted permease)
MEVPSLVEMLGVLASGVGAGAILSFLFEQVDAFHRLSITAKKWLVFFVSLGLPVLATVALQFVPADAWATLAPYWRALALGFVTWGGGQVTHMVAKRINGK